MYEIFTNWKLLYERIEHAHFLPLIRRPIADPPCRPNLLIGISRMLFGLARLHVLRNCNLQGEKIYNKIMASKLIRKVISTPNAPKAAGPYSQAIVADRTIYVAGQLGLDPKDCKLVGEDIQSQTRQCLNNIKNILEAGESSLEKVVKVTVYLADINDYNEMNKVYSEFFQAAKPARVALEVANLPKSARVEIDAIGMVGDVVVDTTQANL